MFDAKSLLESLVKGAQAPAPQSNPASIPGLSDLLGQLQSAGKDGSGSLADILGKLGGQPGGSTDTNSKGGLSDSIQDLGSSASKGAGGITDLLGGILGQATQGVKEGAGKINDATGAGDTMNDAVRQLTDKLAGKTPEEMMAAAKEFMANNKLGTGAALGGLGALILGTSTGRSVAVGAAKIGALALIGGLAYKAYQNYSDGKPPVNGFDAGAPTTPPAGSGFEADAVSNDQAVLYIRAMIAAAAADGRIDATEHERIMDGLKQAGAGAEAEEFLAGELNRPASIDELASLASSKEDAVKIYTAARISIDPDTGGESVFLAQLANQLGIEPDLARHIDAAARANA